MTKLKVSPNNIEAEQSVIWSIFIDKEALYSVIDLVNSNDFYDERHKEIWDTIIILNWSHTPIDLLTVSDNLKKKKKLDDVWWVAYLAELTSIVPTASNIYTYAKLVKDASVRRNIIVAWDWIMWLWYNEETEVTESLEAVEKKVFSISQEFLKERFIHVKDVLSERHKEFARLHDSDEDVAWIQWVATWFKHIDEKLNWLKPADLIILAARPSMWKTALVLNMAQYAAINNKKTVWFFSLEMSKEQLVDRMFCSLVWVDSWKLHKWLLSDEDFSKLWDWMDKLTNANMFIDDSVWASLTEIRAKARRLQMEHWLDMIVIDYLQLMTTGKASLINNRVQEISEISRSLKAIWRELHVPVVALSQLSRAVEARPGKIPMLSDLRDSGSIEQDADVVLMLYREDYYEPDTDRKWLADLFIRKNRNWPIGKIELMFRNEQMRFLDVERDRSEDVLSF